MSNLILAVEVCCHKVQGITEAFFYSINISAVSLEKSGKYRFLANCFCTAMQRIGKSFRYALHLVTAHLHRQNQVAHALRTNTFRTARAGVLVSRLRAGTGAKCMGNTC